MPDFLLKIFMAVNVLLIRISRGRLGAQLGTQRVLLLHTVGRKSGEHRLTPIAYFQVERSYFIIASNWGRDHQAAWFYNLMSQRKTVIEVDGRTLPVEAHPAEGEEYDRLWNYAIQHHPPYLHYLEMTARHIPIVVLVPAL
jgi:deazaflavin-dependent oxidoreductase (nitroreductase family)